MRKSSIFLLAGAVLLGLVAVLGARNMLNSNAQRSAQQQAPQAQVVTAGKDLQFGEKITVEALKMTPWNGPVPDGAFENARDAVGDGSRTALRTIKAGEPLLETAITGSAGRLASSTLLGPDMRAVALPVTETLAAGGFISPGDRVDVILTRSFDQDTAYSAVVVQGARVLAIGQLADTSTTDPQVTRSATLEVTPDDAQRIALGQLVGTLSLALRPTGDESRPLLQTTSANAAFNMRPPARGGGSSEPSAPPAQSWTAAPAAPSAPRPPRGFAGPAETVRVVRGIETFAYEVPR